MSGYRQLREGYKKVVTSDNVTGTRVFIEDSAGTETLPAIGDPFSVGYPECACVSIEETEYHFEGSDCKYKYVCQYNTRANAGFILVPHTDDDNLITSGGSEIVSIDDPTKWYWHKVVGAVNAGDAIVRQRVPMNIVRGTISKTKVIKSTDRYLLYKNQEILPKLGKINAAILDVDDWKYPYQIGNVLFLNTDERLSYDEDGHKQWQVTLNFAYRIIYNNAAVPVPVDYSWHYILRKNRDTGGGEPDWQAPCRVVAAAGAAGDPAVDYLYKTADFSTIFTIPTSPSP